MRRSAAIGYFSSIEKIAEHLGNSITHGTVLNFRRRAGGTNTNYGWTLSSDLQVSNKPRTLPLNATQFPLRPSRMTIWMIASGAPTK